MPEFKDHFSVQAATYAAFRPRYPDELFAWLAGLAPAHRLAWDCGTGSGQAAAALAERFARVVGTDASAAQIAHSIPHPRVEYRVAPAEESGLEAGSCDLVAVAQALHWFDADAFYREARRVLAPAGVLAAWGYGDPVLDDPELHARLHAFNRGLLEPYWPPEREILLAGYRTLPFPFAELPAPELTLRAELTLAELAGLLRSWSATQRYLRRHGRDPVNRLVAELGPLWGGTERRHVVRWPLHLRAGRVDGPGG